MSGIKGLAAGKPNQWADAVDSALTSFAVTNKFTYQHAKGSVVSPTSALKVPELFLPNDAWSPMVTRYMEGTIGIDAFKYYQCMLQIPALESLGAVASTNLMSLSVLTALQVTLPTHVNKLYVGLKHDFSPEIKSVLDTKKMQRRDLEANYSQFYHVYSEADDRLTAHYFLSPEVMEKLLKNKMFDIWIEGNNMVIYCFAPTLQVYLENIKDYFAFAELLIANVDAVKNHRAR